MLFLLVTFLLTACAQSNQGQGLKEISVRLPIPVQDATMTPYFVTLDKGFYTQEGLDVTLNLGSSETNPVKMVAQKSDHIGVLGGPDTLLIAKSKGIDLVAIAVLHRNSDFPVLITLKESNITTIEQLQGKKIGFFYGHISTDVIRHLLAENNIRYEEVNVRLDFSQLIIKEIDAQWAFRTHGPVNLEDKGIELNIISPKEYGIRTHGLTFFTTKEMIQNNPELVKKWLKATIKGIQYMKQNRNKALQSVLERDPKLTLELERKKLDEYINPLSDSEEYPIGYMDHDMFKETYDRLSQQGLLENEFDIQEVYTTQFLEEIHEELRQEE